MKPKLLLCLALVLSGTLIGCSGIAHAASVTNIKISFAKPYVTPSLGGGLPGEALYQPGRNAREKGAFANIVAGRISTLKVTWADPKHFKTENQVRDFLRNLLNSPTAAWTYHVWSFGDGEPMLVATVGHTAGKQGKLFVWYYPNIYWAYQDGNGKWWWSMSDRLKAPNP